MDLIVHFNKKILADIRSMLSEKTNMHSINIVHFCSVLLMKISKGGLNSPVDEQLVSMLCQIFDCVDVDSRGFIDWEDFVSFTLRSGRNSFKPISGYVNVEYLQRMDVTAVMPVKKLYYCNETNLLYAFDGDSPLVRCIRKSGDVVNVFNPVIGISRLIKVRAQGKQPYFAKKNAAKQDAGKLKKKKENNVAKQTVTAMTWIDKKRQMVFATSNSCLSFWNYRLVHLIDFVETSAPQLGMLYSNRADVLLTWAGDKGNYDYSVWDCNSRVLKYQFNMHKSIILATLEISALGAIVSSSMDRALYVWPVSKLFQSRDETFDDKKLVGHTFAIRTVCFAHQNDLIIGAGFDFDIFCWDPTTSSLQMKLVGHRLSIVCVCVINNPFERAASVDESGCVKIWNIDRAQGLKGGMLQSIMLQGAVNNHVFSFISAFDNGAVLACLSEKLLFMELTTTAMEDNRIVHGGLSVCEQNSRIVITSRKTSFEYSLINGESGKVYSLISEECIETCPTAKLVSGVQMGIAKRATERIYNLADNDIDDDDRKHERKTQEIILSKMTQGSKHIFPEDDITCVTCSEGGKKFYAGTNSGRVLMYDGTSLGLLTQLSHEEKLSSRDDYNSGGAVVQLKYCERDETLVAAFAGGAIKVFSGCHRVVTEDITIALQTKEEADIKELLCPYFQGGGPPQTPLLLRLNLRVQETTVTAMDASDKLGLIAVSAVDGTIRVFDYHTLLIRSIYAAPFVGGHPVEIVNLSFVPLAPILIGADSNGRFTAWAVYPMKPSWILTWSLQTCFDSEYMKDDKDSSKDEDSDKPKDSDDVSSEAKKSMFRRKRRSSQGSLSSFASVDDDGYDDISNNTVLSSMRCIVWKEKYSSQRRKMASAYRVKWSIVVGEGNGMMSIIDLTDMFNKIGLQDFKVLKQAYQLNSSAMVYQTIRRTDIKDGLEDFQIRDVEKQVRHPIGFNCFATSTKQSYKDIVIKDVKGVIRWNAHVHGVGEIICKQKASPCTFHSRSQQKEFRTLNSEMTLNFLDAIPEKPYVVVSSSEYGVPKRWTWTGQPYDEDNSGHMLDKAIALNTKLINLEERDSKDKEGDDPRQLPSYPTGGAASRLEKIVEWASPFVKKRFEQMIYEHYNTTRGSSSPKVLLRKSSSVDDGPPSPQSRGNVSEENEDESTGIGEFSPSKAKGGGQNTHFVKDISSIRRKVNEDKMRKEHAIECWESKDRFPNLKTEIRKSEFRHTAVSEEEVKELLGLIEDVKEIPESNPVLQKSYSNFIAKRNEMHSSVNRKMKNRRDETGTATKQIERPAVMVEPSPDGEMSDRDLFMIDIRQLRTSNSNSRASPTPSVQRSGGRISLMNSSSKNLLPSPVSKSGRKFITKADSSRFYSRDMDDIVLDSNDDDELRELGLTIQHRERIKPSKAQSISSIEATMSRFDRITRADDKKYSYKFNRDKAHFRSKKSKKKQSEKPVNDDNRGGVYDENQQRGTIDSESGAGRYGPYKGRDIAAFEDFMSKLPPIHSALDFTPWDFRVGDYFPDILSTVHMGQVYEMSEVLQVVIGFNNKSITNLIKDLNVRLDGTFLRQDLFLSVFPFASNSEKIRIQKYAMIRTVMNEVFKGLNPPPVVVDNFIGDRHLSPGGRQTMISPTKMRISSALFAESPVQHTQQTQNATPIRKMINDKSQKSFPSAHKSTPNPGRMTQMNLPSSPQKGGPSRQVKGHVALTGWTVRKNVFEELKLMFDDFYNDKHGTIVGSELIEICQAACNQLNLEKPPDMSFLALRKSFALTPEIDGDSIAVFFEDVLQIQVS